MIRSIKKNLLASQLVLCEMSHVRPALAELVSRGLAHQGFSGVFGPIYQKKLHIRPPRANFVFPRCFKAAVAKYKIKNTAIGGNAAAPKIENRSGGVMSFRGRVQSC